MSYDIVIEGGSVVVGDGTAPRRANLWIQGGRVVSVDGQPIPSAVEVEVRFDASGCVVLPGVINAHAHGCSIGPLFPSGALALSTTKAKRNLDRHLQQGVTTLFNVDGFTMPDEVLAPALPHPMRRHFSTAHLPSAIRAADLVDGRGLSPRHRHATAEEMVEAGAVAIGEVGGGHTLGGGGSDYRYIPLRLREVTGVDVDPNFAQKLKFAVLGTQLFGEVASDLSTDVLVRDSPLAGRIEVSDVEELVRQVVLPPITAALAEFAEAEDVGRRVGRPLIVHSSSVSADVIRGMAREVATGRLRVVAGHSNHNTFTVEGCIDQAVYLRKHGVTIDVSTLDGIVTHWRNDAGRLDALAQERLIDTISTDYSDGHWDGQLEAVHHLVTRGLYPLGEAVAMVTGNVARAFQPLLDDRGRLVPGCLADAVVADELNVGRVRSVIIGGAVCVDNGWLRYP